MAKAGVRRSIIREWMGLARDNRQTMEQASAFARSAAQRHELPRRRRSPYAIVMGWLSPRTGRA
ncbi:MAG: hypothetical protein P4M07_04105 [Xanthobacteraceae bacterium]|nr:hypothetical protein [Xanthobacteraceae bacterium]